MPINTKDRIIQAAITLFNNHGISNVSIRQIAAEIDISPGNLTYHYKNTSYIFREIYNRMDVEMSEVVSQEGDLSLEHYHILLQRTDRFQHKYRFFFLDMLEVARQYPAIIKRYRQSVVLLREQYVQLIKVFVAKGLINREPTPGFYKTLFHSIWVMSTFWIQQEKILGQNHPLFNVKRSSERVWEILLPYLTEKGLAEYKSFMSPSKKEEESSPIRNLYLNS